MKIAIVAFEDLKDIKLWASIPYFIIKQLRKNGHEVHLIDKIPDVNKPYIISFKRIWYNKILKRKKGIYRFERTNSILKTRSKVINERLSKIKPDLVLTFFTYQAAFIKTPTPIAIWTDATFSLLNKYYPSYKSFCKESIIQSNLIEKKALDNTSLIFTSSNWAKNAMIEDYNVNENKIRVIPFGANIESGQSISPSYDNSLSIINILFVGFDYERKGLKKIVDILSILNKKNPIYQLTVVGPNKMPSFCNRKDITFIGKLNKDIPSELKTLDELYKKAHLFMILPKMEAYGIVFCEAASYSLPIISHAVGGITEIVKNGINGYIFKPEISTNKIADKITAIFKNRDEYFNLRKSTLIDYQQRLNWNVSINIFEKKIEKIIKSRYEN